MASELTPRDARQLRDDNRRFYDSLWSDARLVEPERFNTWSLVRSVLPGSGRQLEVAPGLRPRLPIEGTLFVDISHAALLKLAGRGAQVVLSQITSLPFADGAFDLVCALDIIEHVEDEDEALAELARVAAPGATLLVSAPLHPAMWTSFDDFVGHKRRYEPLHLLAKLAQHGLAVLRSAIFGMKWLTNHRERAMWFYNRAMMPLGLRLQKQLQLVDGMIATENVDEVLLV